MHDNDVDITPLLSIQNAAPGGSGDGEDCDGVERGNTHARLHDDAQSGDDENDPVDTLGAILGHMSQREDVGCNDDGVEVGVGVGVGAVVGKIGPATGVRRPISREMEQIPWGLWSDSCCARQEERFFKSAFGVLGLIMVLAEACPSRPWARGMPSLLGSVFATFAVGLLLSFGFLSAGG